MLRYKEIKLMLLQKISNMSPLDRLPSRLTLCKELDTTRSTLDKAIKELEGDENKNLEKYATTDSPEYQKMVNIIAERFGLSSLKFNTLETLIEAIGLPKCKVCTHCFDGSSHF